MKVAKDPSLIPSRFRLGLTLAIVIMVITAPIIMLVDPIQVLAATTTGRVDTSGYHASPQTTQKTSMPESTSSSSTPTMAAPAVSSQGNDGDFTTQAALSLTRATQTDNLVNSKTYYDISFRTATAGIIKHIQMTFPPGTYVGAAVLIEAVGIGPGTIAASGSTATGMTLTYTVTNEVNVPALTRMRIQIANANNPPDPSTSLTVTITTRDSANNIIDGPTATNVYNIKQIATNDIADLSITNPKLADDAVTSTKLGDNAVTTPKIVDNAVTTDKIQDSQVNTNDLADSSVTNQKLAPDAVTTDKIADGNVGTNDIADSAVTTPKIADDAVTAAKLMEDLVHVVWSDNALGPEVIFYKRDGGGFDPSINPLIGGTLSSIAVSGSDVHVVLFSSSANNVLYARSTNGGGSFTTLASIGTGGPTNNPSVAASGNNVYVVYEEILGNSEIRSRISTNGGTSFGGPINLSNSPGSSALPSVAASGSNVYVVWREDISGNNEILYRRSTDGGANFEPTVNLSNNAGGSGLPSVAISGNNVYVVWEDNTLGNNEILYRRSTDGGANFEPTVNLSNNAGSSLFASIAASGNNVYVVWDDNPSGPEIVYTRSTDGGANFEPTVNLSNSPSAAFSASVAAKGDNVYTVWHENAIGNTEIVNRRSADGGANFDVIATNLSNNAGASRDSHIAVS